MDVRFVDGVGSAARTSGDVVALLDRDDGFVWVDVPPWDDEARSSCAALGCHPLVLEACRQRNHVPTVHGYADHYFVTMHTPLQGERRPRAPARARPDHRGRGSWSPCTGR